MNSEILKEKQRAQAELVFAGVIWGFGFVATIWALQDFSVMGYMVVRFLLATLIGEFVRVFIFKQKFWNAQDFRYALFAGFFMASFILPQSIGLLYTTASHSGFLTILYVILVPLLSFHKKHSWSVYALALFAFIGAALLMNVFDFQLNPGDLWTLLCAFGASLHILYLGKIAHRAQNAFRLNNFQSFWCLVFSLPLISLDPHFSMMSIHWKPWLGVFSTVVGSTIIGFMIQIRAQKVLSETTAAQFFLLESPFALFFGFLILNERITWIQGAGALMILLSSFLTLKLENAQTRKKSGPLTT